MTPSQIAHWMLRDRHNITTLAGRMQKDGLIRTECSVRDKRQIIRFWGCLGVAIRRGCGLMKLARSSFYYQPWDKGAGKKADVDLKDRIEIICLGFPRYGYRRVTWQLKREGKQVNHKKVLRLMQESNLLYRVRRKRVKTTASRHRFPRYPNLVKGVTIRRLNQVWLSDITHIRIRTGFVYLAAILDAYSRKVIGYAVSTALDTALTLQALKMAIAGRKPGAGVIHHSDQGVQYASDEYVAELQSHGFLVSMARTGNPYENAMMESFFKTLK